MRMTLLTWSLLFPILVFARSKTAAMSFGQWNTCVINIHCHLWLKTILWSKVTLVFSWMSSLGRMVHSSKKRTWNGEGPSIFAFSAPNLTFSVLSYGDGCKKEQKCGLHQISLKIVVILLSSKQWLKWPTLWVAMAILFMRAGTVSFIQVWRYLARHQVNLCLILQLQLMMMLTVLIADEQGNKLSPPLQLNKLFRLIWNLSKPPSHLVKVLANLPRSRIIRICHSHDFGI